MMSMTTKFTGTPRDDPISNGLQSSQTSLTRDVVSSTRDRKCDTARLSSTPKMGLDVPRHAPFHDDASNHMEGREAHSISPSTYQFTLCNNRLLVVTTLGMLRHYAYGEGGSSRRRLIGHLFTLMASHPFSSFSCSSRKRKYVLFYDNNERISVKTPRCFAAHNNIEAKL